MTVQHHIPQMKSFLKGSKSRIGIDLSTENLKNQSTLLNGSSSSFISGITNTQSLRNIDQ